MRIRIGWSALLIATLAVFAVTPAVAWGAVPVAQEDEQPAEDGKASPSPEAETDPGSDEAAVEETGPIWTYQMAWITLGGLVLLLAATGFLYWRLVIVRTRRGM